jgi:hypothetical protein
MGLVAWSTYCLPLLQGGEKERHVNRWMELGCGVSACVLGLIGVVTEAQALSNPVENPSLSWLLGTNAVPGVWEAIQTTHAALFPLALVLLALAFGAYLHGIHEQTAGLGLLAVCSTVTVTAAGFGVFDQRFSAILFIPAPLVVLTVVLVAATLVSAFTLQTWVNVLPRIRVRHFYSPNQP